MRRNISASAEILAGLRFDKALIRQLFTEEIMQESVIYQDIIQKGLQKGLQQGRKEGELAMIVRLLARRFGAVEPQLLTRLQNLTSPQLEELGVALLDFSAISDLLAWLDAQG